MILLFFYVQKFIAIYKYDVMWLIDNVIYEFDHSSLCLRKYVLKEVSTLNESHIERLIFNFQCLSPKSNHNSLSSVTTMVDHYSTIKNW